MMHTIQSHIFKRTSGQWLTGSRGGTHSVLPPQLQEPPAERSPAGSSEGFRVKQGQLLQTDYQTDLRTAKPAGQEDKRHSKLAGHRPKPLTPRWASGGHLGTLTVLAYGLFLLGSGVWDTFTQEEILNR